ncbi:hypothetical protein [Fibrella forsythiae]|uniref:Lipoprotein n=1 Tax=Fibrella forsythiae TaxID=2817061 RepID=A0ABS3JR08_9BACT|nr:hypothetical protein [Fibrella forsythiae]MBO0952450.1 hypothetical protein [Fibrella forsythiae]
MKGIILLFALASCLACSRPPTTFNNPYGVTALLNDSTWFGRAYAAEAAALNNNPCATGRFTVFLDSNVGYPGDQLRLSPQQMALQAGEFVARQRLTFYNIPARKGSYRINELNQCGGIVASQGNFALLGNGSALMEPYFLQPTQTGRVRIMKIDSAARTVTGKFKVTLTAPGGRVARFRQGWFIARLPKK